MNIDEKRAAGQNLREHSSNQDGNIGVKASAHRAASITTGRGKEGMETILMFRPSSLILLLLYPFCLLCLSIPDTIYTMYWRTPKYITSLAYGLVTLALGGIAAGSFLSERAAGQKKNARSEAEYALSNKKDKRGLLQSFFVLYVLTMTGYVVWVWILRKNGLSLGTLDDMISRQQMSMYEFRSFSEFIPGLTTWMQAGPVVLIIGAILWADPKMGRWIRSLCYALILLMSLRAFFNSERLALLEGVIPFIVTRTAISWQYHMRRIVLAGLIPLLAVGVVILFFVTEWFRFWLNVGENSGMGYFEFVSGHLLAYYATALNNGFMFYSSFGVTWSLTTTLNWLFSFPIVGNWIFEYYGSLVNVKGLDMAGSMLQSYANPQFNNMSGIFPIYSDAGIIGGIIIFIIFGLISGWSYSQLCKEKISGLLTYPIFLICVLEIPRVFLVSSTRFFPTWLGVAITLGIISLNRIFSAEAVK